MLLVERLVDPDGLGHFEGGIPVRIEVDWSLGEDSSSSFLFLVLSELC